MKPDEYPLQVPDGFLELYMFCEQQLESINQELAEQPREEQTA